MKLEGKRVTRSKASVHGPRLAFAGLASFDRGLCDEDPTDEPDLGGQGAPSRRARPGRPPALGSRSAPSAPSRPRLPIRRQRWIFVRGLVNTSNATDDDLEPKRTSTNDVPSSQHEA